MSYKDQRQQLGIEPAGSLAPLNSTQDGSKWHHGVTTVGIARLSRISGEINEAFDQGVRSHVKMQIAIGRLLNEAREEIPGDRQFGQWRDQNTPITNKSTANKLMNLAKQVGDGRITQDMVAKLPLSNLKELLTAPDSVLGEISERLEAGDQPTRDEIRALSRGDSAPESASDVSPSPAEPAADLRPESEPEAPESPAEEAPKATPAPPPQTKGPISPASPPRVTPASQIPKILAMTLIERVRHLDTNNAPPYDGCKPEEWAWLVMGLDPHPAYFPSTDVIEVLGAEWVRQIEASGNPRDVDRLVHTVQRAEKICSELAESEM